MEFVFVVPRERLFPDAYPHGLVLFGEGFEARRFEECLEQHGYFVEREHAEHDPALQQVIPYTLVVRDGEVFLLTRSKRGGEARLHDKLSIGVGGHINPVDLPSPAELEANPAWSRRNPVPKATRREVTEEELRVEGSTELHVFGVLNDDSNPVGAVHVGLVQTLVVDGPVEVRETDQLHGRFVPVDELRKMLGAGANFETWSALLIERIDQLVPHSARV